MNIAIKKAQKADCKKIYDMQIKAFKPLLEKYGDYDTSPGSEDIKYILKWFDEPFCDIYIIVADETDIGAVIVFDFKKVCELNRIYITKEYCGKGYAQQVIKQIEKMYPCAQEWGLETIMQERKLCYLYEKMGYQRADGIEHIKDNMDIVRYKKAVNSKDD